VFCPNCGTQNDSAATPCKKCGFKLSSISVPRFKGTMMLNSEQTVQELIEEHRRKQAQAVPAEKKSSQPAPKRSVGSSAPPGSSGSPKGPSAPPGSSSGPRGPVLQPPRVAASRGRMGGTMMGVAPQAGGVVPPPSGFPRPADVAPITPTPAQAPAPAREPARNEAPVLEQETRAARTSVVAPAPGDSSADPLAGTVAVPVVESPEIEAAFAAPGTNAAPVTPAPLPELPSDKAPVTPIARTRTESGAAPPAQERAAETKPPQARAIAATAALPQQPEVAASKAAPSRIRPLDVVLIVCTLGLYGIVLWFKQRKPT
jgi:hypothetical protein